MQPSLTSSDTNRADAVPPNAQAVLGLVELFTLFVDDDRPTFAIDTTTSRIVFRNAALDEIIAAIPEDISFEEWTQELSDAFAQADRERTSSTFESRNYGRYIWRCRILAGTNYVLVHCAWNTRLDGVRTSTDKGAPAQTSLKDCRTSLSNGDQDTTSSRDRDYKYEGVIGDAWYIDWVQSAKTAKDPWAQFLQDHDWTKTKLGPMHTWPTQLRQLIIMVCACPDPRTILWGEDNLLLFNQQARFAFGESYVTVLGNSAQDIYGRTIADSHFAILREGLRQGKPAKLPQSEYLINRSGYLEEVYTVIDFVPICSPQGHLAGMLGEFAEITSTVIQARRNKLFTKLLDGLGQAREPTAVWSCVLEAFGHSTEYVPFAVLYIHGQQKKHSRSPDQFLLHGTVGICSSSLPATIDLDENSPKTGLARTLDKYQATKQICVIERNDDDFPRELGVEVSPQGHVNAVCVLRIADMSTQTSVAFLVLGLNPRKPFEKEDLDLMNAISAMIIRCNALVSVPTERQDATELARLNREMAQELRILQAENNLELFSRMADTAPFGMYITTPDLVPKYFNNECLRLMGFTSLEQVVQLNKEHVWWQYIIPLQDLEHAAKTQADVQAGVPVKSEFHLHRPVHTSTPDDQREFTRWVENITFPERDASGKVVSLYAFMTDVTDRLAQKLQSQRLEDAVATRKAADSFIDMVSHEVRNPLSAILQLSDAISTSFSLEHKNEYPELAENIDMVLDASQTITLCAEHQKSIVDDILVLSKLDSDLLRLLVERAQPIELLRQALKMHQSEFVAADIATLLVIEDSYYSAGIDYVLMDHRRTLQIILNLVGNAIKFTRTSKQRKITMSLAASSVRPSEALGGVVFGKGVASGDRQALSQAFSPLESSESDENTYVTFAITDTGRGLAREEMSHLFERFSQGSIKTYKKYGGSGLGLFISKRLSELQGGQISVESQGLGKGSTFAFYIKAQRCDRMPTAQEEPATPDATTTPPKPLEGTAQPRKEPGNSTTDDKGASSTSTSCHLDILLVEDNVINQKVMTKQLRRLGCKVTAANHGLEALEVIRRSSLLRANDNNKYSSECTPISVILMDVEMPVMDGLVCTRKIRELEDTGELIGHVPIIAVTANARAEQIQDAKANGVDEVITKPFRIPELVPLMESLVSRKIE